MLQNYLLVFQLYARSTQLRYVTFLYVLASKSMTFGFGNTNKKKFLIEVYFKSTHNGYKIFQEISMHEL